MKGLDDVMIQIREEELYSGLEERDLLSTEPLSRREAEKIFRQVRAKKEGETVKPRRKMKKVFVVLAAAVIAAFGLTATGGLWPVLFDNDPPSEAEDLRWSSTARMGWEGINWEAFSQIAVDPGVSVQDGGVTVSVKKVVYSGTTMLAEVEVAVPDDGAWTDHSRLIGEKAGIGPIYEKFGFEDFEVYVGFLGSPGIFTTWKDSDPDDNILHLYIACDGENWDLLTADFEAQVFLNFENFSYLDGRGERKSVEGNWNLTWKIDNRLSENYFESSFTGPIAINHEQALKSLTISEHWLYLELGFTDTYDVETDPVILSPVIEYRDGSSLSYDYPIAHCDLLSMRDGAILYVFFPEPVDLDEVSVVRIGEAVIPIDH